MSDLNGAVSAYDGETGLYSRTGLTERVRQLLETDSHHVLACLVIRLFVDAGETSRIVQGAVAALTATTRTQDVVARLAHTDFAVVAPDSDATGARRLAERLAAAVREVFAGTGRQGRVRLVVGYDFVASLTAGAIGAETLLFRATAAACSGVPDASGRWLRRYDRAFERISESELSGPLVEDGVPSHGTGASWTPP